MKQTQANAQNQSEKQALVDTSKRGTRKLGRAVTEEDETTAVNMTMRTAPLLKGRTADVHWHGTAECLHKTVAALLALFENNNRTKVEKRRILNSEPSAGDDKELHPVYERECKRRIVQ